MSLQRGKAFEPFVQAIDGTGADYRTGVGTYFFGQTGLLTFGDGSHAWGGLFNPDDSGIHLGWNGFTVTNYSPEPFTVEVWLLNHSLGKGTISRNVASANQAIRPVPIPKVELRDADRLYEAPKDGRFSFVRIAEPKATLTEHDFPGLILLPPGSSIIAFLRSPEAGTVRSRVAFGWWEGADVKERRR